MTGPGSELPGQIADDVMRLQSRAAGLPNPDEVRTLAERAVRHGGTEQMSLPEIRTLAATAVRQADEVASLLRKLNTLLEGGDGT